MYSVHAVDTRLQVGGADYDSKDVTYDGLPVRYINPSLLWMPKRTRAPSPLITYSKCSQKK